MLGHFLVRLVTSAEGIVQSVPTSDRHRPLTRPIGPGRSPLVDATITPNPSLPVGHGNGGRVTFGKSLESLGDHTFGDGLKSDKSNRKIVGPR